MLKKLYWALTLILVIVAIAGCVNKSKNECVNDTADETTSEVGDKMGYTVRQELYVTFAEAVETSDCVAVATFVSYEDKNEVVDYVFTVKEVLRGDVENTIHVTDSKGWTEISGTELQYKNGQDIYTVGEDYILVMEKFDSLFYEYPQYVISGNIFIPVKDLSQSTMYGEPLTESEIQSIDTAKSYMKNARTMGDIDQKDYTTATDLPTILRESDLVLEVKVTELEFESEFANSNTYFCDVLNILKGDSFLSQEGREDIMITLMKGSVEVGGTYVVLVNQVGEDSTIYTQSSLNSVVPSSDTDTINEIQSLIAQA